MYIVQVYAISKLLKRNDKDGGMKGTARGMAILCRFASGVVDRKPTDSKDTLAAGGIGELNMGRAFRKWNGILSNLRSCCGMVIATVTYGFALGHHFLLKREGRCTHHW